MTGRSIFHSLLLAGSVGLAAATNPVVRVLNGSYEGLHLPSFQQDVFLGVPYAQDTGGANRFRVPQALEETWSGVREAKVYAPACPDNQLVADGYYGMGEDCLSINIVRPAHGNYGVDSGIGEGKDGDTEGDGENVKTQKLPVLLWIHGGGYQFGTSGLPNYNLTYLVQRSVDVGLPVLAASINYRKGAWGNMYSREIQVR